MILSPEVDLPVVLVGGVRLLVLAPDGLGLGLADDGGLLLDGAGGAVGRREEVAVVLDHLGARQPPLHHLRRELVRVACNTRSRF